MHFALGGASRRIGCLLLGACVLVACSTGGGGGNNLGSGTQPVSYQVVCTYIAQLPDSASLLQRLDVRDPQAFTRVLNDAVKQYVNTLDQIAPRVDANLKTTVKQVRELVLHHRFSDATTARVPLDTWTADHC